MSVVGVVLGSIVWGAASPATAAGSPADQILNLRTVREDLDVEGMIAFNSKVYFVADDDKYGRELWETDGTEVGTKLVKDIATGTEYGNPRDSEPEDLTVVGSKLYFTADDGLTGRELWATDGTTTDMVKDIGGEYGSSPGGLRNVAGTLIFRANDGVSGMEPWKSDGTAGGTTLIADIYPGAEDAIYDDTMAVVGSTAYVSARDEAYDFEVWAVTTSGATIVSDITVGSEGSSPTDLIAAGGSVYFTVDGPGASERDSYRYDGTNLVRVKAGYYPGENFTEIDSDTIVFAAMDGSSYEELWVTDGTADSAQLLKNICEVANRGSDPSNFVKMGTKVYFTANDCVNGPALWETDGTTVGTKMVKDLVTVGGDANNLSPDIKYLTVVGSTLYFRATDRGKSDYDDDAVGIAAVQYGEELWKSDGTPSGTVLVKDINTEVDDGRPEGSGISLGDDGPQAFPVLDGNIVFRACDGTVCGLWESDGTDVGTTLIANPNPVDRDSSPVFLGSGNNKAFFRARDDNGSGLFVTDGTAGGTTKLTTRYVEEGVVLGGKLIFGGADDVAGGELWISDGTPGGTVLLKDLYPGVDGESNPNSSSPGYLTVAGPYVYFRAMNADGQELWRTDGTDAGTIMLTNVVSAEYPYGADPQYVTAVGSQVYFQGRTAETGSEPWKSNGTVAGTMMVKDINPGGDYYSGSYPYAFVKAGTTVFFTAVTPTTGRELWKTDGTDAGTALVKDIRPGEQYPGEPYSAFDASNRESFVALGGKAYFSADDGSGGAQLWTSNGTEVGTYKVKQVSTYEYTSGPNPIIAFNNRLFFNVRESNPVERLWSSDGTEAGTGVLKDVAANYYNWRSAGDRLYFTAYADGGEQIWGTDGTEAGTTKLTGGLTDVGSLLPFRGGLLFGASNGTNGREPWSVGLPVGTPQTITFTPPTDMKANEAFALSATATSGLPVTFTALGDCLIKTTGKNAGKLKLEGKGYCVVRASQAGDETWSRADDVEVGIVISRNSVTVAFVRVVPAPAPSSVSPFTSGRVRLQAQVTPALEGCQVQFDVLPNNGVPAGPYLGISDEDGVVLSEPISLPIGTYDFTVTPLGDCEGVPVQAPSVYVGELPPTGASTASLVIWALVLASAGLTLAVVARRRHA